MPDDKLTRSRAAPDRRSGALAPVLRAAARATEVNARVPLMASIRRNARGDHRRVTPGPDARCGLTPGEQSIGRALNQHGRSRRHAAARSMIFALITASAAVLPSTEA
jgi:hypothetical protein